MALSIGELLGYVDLDAGPAEKAGDRISGMFDKMGGHWTKILGGAGIAAGGAFAGSLIGAINLEPSRDRVAAALSLSKDEAERAGKVSGKLYAGAWGESAEEVDAAIEAVMSSIRGMRHASESELQKVTEAALTVASTFQVDVVRATQVAGNMVANGMAKNGIQAMDLLSKALSKVPVQLREDVMDAADEYGQFFNTLGIKGPQAMGMLASGARKGMYGIDKAGDAVKEFTIRSTDMSSASKAAYDQIGLDAGKMANDILAGGERARKATDKIVTGLLGIQDPAKRANAAIALFGTPLEDIGVKDIPKFLRSLRDGAKGMDGWKGSVKRAGATLNDNARTNLTSFTRGLKMGFIDLLGGKVLPIVTDWTGRLNTGLGPALHMVGDMLSTVTQFLSQHHGVALALVGVIAALTLVTAAHSAVLAVSAAGGMASWLKGTKAISAATKVWAAMQWALNIAMSANPLVLIVLGVMALVAAFIIAYKKSETFRNIVNGALNAVKGAASATFGWIKDHWPLLLAILTGPFGLAVLLIVKKWDAIKSGATNAKDWVVRKFGDLVRFVTGLPGKIGSAASGMFDGIKDAFRSAINWVIRAWNGLDFKLPSVDTHIPGLGKVGGFTLGTPNIPELATGGRATAATLAVIGEGREPETVLPDSVLRGLLERAHDAGAEGRGGDTWNIYGAPGMDEEYLAEKAWYKTRTRG